MSSPAALPTTTTRVVLPGLVEPSGLQVTTAPVPTPGPGQLLVAVEATGISYAEQAMRKGRYFGQPAFPFTPGYDLVGRVLAGRSGRRRRAARASRVATMTKTGPGRGTWPWRPATACRPEGARGRGDRGGNGVTAWRAGGRGDGRVLAVGPGPTPRCSGAGSPR